MKKPSENEYRDEQGRYQYFGDFDRLCKCGHTLGVHIAGGYECGTDPECQRFRPTGKRRAR